VARGERGLGGHGAVRIDRRTTASSTLTRTPGDGARAGAGADAPRELHLARQPGRDVRLDRRDFSATTTFIPARGIAGEPGERIEIGEREAIEELARAIVTEMRGDF
jgi:hypothetical protein